MYLRQTSTKLDRRFGPAKAHAAAELNFGQRQGPQDELRLFKPAASRRLGGSAPKERRFNLYQQVFSQLQGSSYTFSGHTRRPPKFAVIVCLAFFARGKFKLIKAQLVRHMRRHVDSQLYDESLVSSQRFAIYSLSDPRDIRQVRYVGQTSDPRRRFLQHISTARLWIPHDTPWWFQAPRLRPLYDWIRELYLDEGRLPTMVISAWAMSIAEARLAERARIYECLQSRLRLLNIEAQIQGGQVPLI